MQRAIAGLIKEVKQEAVKGKKYTATEVRDAANRFSNKTSTGIDNWSLKEIALMPDPILTSLADILSEMRDSGIPPLQALTNIMASIPKKDGGSRTVAIASTIYRLLMEMDNEEVAAFEAANAYHHDSAAAGASAVAVAEDRAMEAELARLTGFVTISTLWDLKKLFDSIDIATLINLARDLGFPLKQLALFSGGAPSTPQTEAWKDLGGVHQQSWSFNPGRLQKINSLRPSLFAEDG